MEDERALWKKLMPYADEMILPSYRLYKAQKAKTEAQAASPPSRAPEKLARAQGAFDAQSLFGLDKLAEGEGYDYAGVNHMSGALREVTDVDPVAQVSAAFDTQQNAVDRSMAAESTNAKSAAARKLHYKTTFRGLPISIENRVGSHRYWYDPHTDEKGQTKMIHAYGYIRRTKGLDGDHVDCFIGPNEDAKSVYVVMTNKPPDFHAHDEEKCMLGFDSMDEAKKAFLAHYDDPRFVDSITAMPFADFEKRVFQTFDGARKKVAFPSPPTGVVEKERGYPPTGPWRQLIDGRRDTEDQVSAAFGFHDLDQDTTVIE